MKKIGNVIALLLCVVLAVPMIQNEKISAAESVKVTIKKEAVTYRDADGTLRGVVSFQYPVISGSSSAVKSVNAKLKKQAENFVKSSQASNIKEYVEAAIENNGFYDEKEYYYYKTTCKVTYNRKNVVSFHYTERWYAGGVYNRSDYGHTYNTKSWKELSAVNVIPGNAATVRQTVVKYGTAKLKKQSPDFYSAGTVALKKVPVSKYKFYLTAGKAVVCFGSYELNCGTSWYLISVPGVYK